MKIKQLFTYITIASVSVTAFYIGTAISDSQLKFPGPWGSVLIPSIAVSESYDDNIWLQNAEVNTQSSWKTTFSPALIWSVRKGHSNYTIRARIERGIYHSSHIDNYTDSILNASAQHKFNRRNKLNILLAYNYLHEQRGSGLNQGITAALSDSPVKYAQWNIGGHYIYGVDCAKG